MAGIDAHKKVLLVVVDTRGKLRNKIRQLQLVLEGKPEEPSSLLLQLQQQRLDAAERDTLEQRIQQKLQP